MNISNRNYIFCTQISHRIYDSLVLFYESRHHSQVREDKQNTSKNKNTLKRTSEYIIVASEFFISFSVSFCKSKQVNVQYKVNQNNIVPKYLRDKQLIPFQGRSKKKRKARRPWSWSYLDFTLFSSTWQEDRRIVMWWT